MIVPFAAEHVPDVARLHCASLGGLLTELSARSVRAYYRGAVRLEHTVGFVHTDGGVVSGFVAGSVHPDRMKGGAFRANPWGILAGILSGAIRTPSTLLSLARSLRGPDSGSYDSRVPELTYLASDANSRRQGVGRKLVDAFSGELRARGVSAYELSVDEANRAASAFYGHLGFRQVGQYREFGTEFVRYRMDLVSSPASSAPRP